MIKLFPLWFLFFAACLSLRAKPDAGYQFALTEERIGDLKQETYQTVLRRPHPEREKEMIANLPKEAPGELEDPPRKRFVSEDGFPLISFKGGPLTLGEALGFIAGSAGYRVEWEEGVNKALPVTTTFTDTPLHKAVAALLEPFGYFALIDGKKGIVRVSLKPEIDVEKDPSRSTEGRP